MVMRSLISVVDDDESVRESLPDLLRVSSALPPRHSRRRKSSSRQIALARPNV
jgi:FixJ family two-component response regulator